MTEYKVKGAGLKGWEVVVALLGYEICAPEKKKRLLGPGSAAFSITSTERLETGSTLPGRSQEGRPLILLPLFQ